jgi:putative membrane-bound dehydrogenase-like protein
VFIEIASNDIPKHSPIFRPIQFIACMFLFLISSRGAVDTATAQDRSSPVSPYRVGAAQIDITPDYPVRLSGFAFRNSESEGVSARIWARALAIQYHDEAPAVVLTVDNLGLRWPMVTEVAQRLAAAGKLPADRLTVTFTHSHCTPKLNGAADNIFAAPIPVEQQARLDRYTMELSDALFQVALEAIESLQPASLHYGIGKVTFAANRRTPNGPVDHSLPMLIARNKAGKTIAVYTSYACHCVTLSHNRIDGDWAGYAASAIERAFPGAIGLISIGCGSDQNPSSGVTGDNIAMAQMQGLEIADEAKRLSDNDQLQQLSGSLNVTGAVISLPLAPHPTRQQWEELAQQTSAEGYNAKTQLARWDRGDAPMKALPYPIQTWTFGDELALVFLSGEVCVDYALRLKRELSETRLWVHGYSNDFGSYIPSERLLREGGYGAGAEIPYFALPTPLQSGLEEQIVAEVRRQLPTSFTAQQSPQDALRQFQLDPELRIELVAAEPQVADPVAIDFGYDGSLFVAQMTDYGRGAEEDFTHRGEVRRLTDQDGDGYFETASVYLSGLRFPTDVKIWRDGILVCDAPNILFARDLDQDGIADETSVLFSGFATHNAQARVNSLRWGLDGWLYGSGGLFGGQITNERGELVDVTDRDFRLDVDRGVIQALPSRSQQGRDRDDWDNWYGCDNSTLAYHFPQRVAWSTRNPHVSLPPAAHYVPQGENAGQLFPPEQLVLFPLSGSGGRATAACGLTIYRDRLLGEAYAGNLFTCEPVNQLVYRQVLDVNQSVATGRRAPNEVDCDFLTSTDPWFRPVQARTGTDGGLWIVDMRRYVIEHPRWIPDEVRSNLDLFAGQGQGRIYRILPASTPIRSLPSLAHANEEDLLPFLNSKNGLLRDLAHQMLRWQQATCHPQLIADVAKSSSSPAVRLSSLAILLDLHPELAQQVCPLLAADPNPYVRKAALLGLVIPKNVSPETDIVRLILLASKDASPQVRSAAAESLRDLQTSISAPVLSALFRDEEDPYVLAAAFASLTPENVVALEPLLLADSPITDERMANLLRSHAALANSDDVRRFVIQLLEFPLERLPHRIDHLATYLSALTTAGTIDWRSLPTATELAVKHRERALTELTNAEITASKMTHHVKLAILMNRLASEPESAAIRLRELLTGYLSLRFPPPIQFAAIEALAMMGNREDGQVLLEQTAEVSQDARKRITQTMIARPDWAPLVLAGLESGSLRVGDLEMIQWQTWIETTASEVQEPARLYFANQNATSTSLTALADQLASFKSDIAQGKEIFQKHCSACHVFQGAGFAVGPNLDALTGKTFSSLLKAIVEPNADLDLRYQRFVALTQDGFAHAGILTSDLDSSLVLRDAMAKDVTLLKAELETIRGTGVSTMPTGFAETLGQQALADLIAYLLTPEVK